jgi:hypothetical protein
VRAQQFPILHVAKLISNIGIPSSSLAQQNGAMHKVVLTASWFCFDACFRDKDEEANVETRTRKAPATLFHFFPRSLSESGEGNRGKN